MGCFWWWLFLLLLNRRFPTESSARRYIVRGARAEVKTRSRPAQDVREKELHMNVHHKLAIRCKQYPLYSQENVSDPIVCAKLFFPSGAATWYVTEYNPATCVAFGYVVGLGTDEWGYFSIDELFRIKAAGVFSIEVDLHFKPTPASQLGISR